MRVWSLYADLKYLYLIFYLLYGTNYLYLLFKNFQSQRCLLSMFPVSFSVELSETILWFLMNCHHWFVQGPSFIIFLPSPFPLSLFYPTKTLTPLCVINPWMYNLINNVVLHDYVFLTYMIRMMLKISIYLFLLLSLKSELLYVHLIYSFSPIGS